MGRVEKGIKCSINNCNEIAIRSISIIKVESAGLKINETKRGYLCKQHYKEYKKKSEDNRKVERWRWNT